MEKEDIVELVKEIGLGVNSASAYPPNHPMTKGHVSNIVDKLHSLSSETSEISLVFFESNIIVKDYKINAADSPLFRSLIKRFGRLGVDSITIETDCVDSDIQGLLEVAITTPSDAKGYEDINTLLIEKKANKVYFNSVEFKITSKGAEIEGGGVGAGIGGGMGVPGLEGIGLGGDTGEFNIDEFLEKGCGLTGGETPKEEADKITRGLKRMYDRIISMSGEEGLKDYAGTFNEIIASISRSARKELLNNKIRIKEISEIIKSIIITLPDEEIVEVFLSKTRLAGIFDAQDLLDEISPERLDKLLPEIKEGLKTLDIEDEYIKQLEEAVWEGKTGGKGGGEGIGEGRGEGEGEGGEGSGGEGDGEGGGQGTAVKKGDIFEKFKDIPDEEYGERDIVNFFHSVLGLKKGEAGSISRISDALETFSQKFIKKYGEEEMLKQAYKLNRSFKIVSEPVRKDLFLKILNKGSERQMTMVKMLLPVMKGKWVISGILNLLKENKRDRLFGFLSALDENRKITLKKGLFRSLEKMDWEKEQMEELWNELVIKAPVGGVGKGGGGGKNGVSVRAYKRLQDRLRIGMDLSETSSLIDSLFTNLDSDTEEVVISALKTIREVAGDFYKAEKLALVKRMVDKMMEQARSEENPNIYEEYIHNLVLLGEEAMELEHEFIIKDIVAFFAKETGSIKKAKVIVPYLPRLDRSEVRNILLSLLWEDEIRDLVWEKIGDFGESIIPELMELLVETEDKNVRLSLIDAIQSMEEKAVKPVKKYLDDDSWYVVRNAVKILGQIADEDIIEDIVNIKSRDARVHIEVIRSLKHILKEDAVPHILNYVNSGSPSVTYVAINALRNIISGKDLHVLEKRLKKEKFQMKDEVKIKTLICKVLGDEGGIGSIDYLKEIVDSKKIFGIPQYPEKLRLAAVKAISDIGGDRARVALSEFVGDRNSKISSIANRAVKKSG